MQNLNNAGTLNCLWGTVEGQLVNSGSSCALAGLSAASPPRWPLLRARRRFSNSSQFVARFAQFLNQLLPRVKRFRALEYGGPHANHMTEMALASFPDGSYLELMGIQHGADPAAVASHTWSQFLRRNGGPCAFALRVTDVNAEIERLKRAGIRVGAAEKSGRTRPDGVTLFWETADVGPGPRGSFFPFLIRDFTPRENRAYPSGKPTTAQFRGIALVVIGVRNLEASIAQYRKAFDLPAPKRQRDEAFGADLVWFEGSPVVLAAPMPVDSWLARRIAQYSDSPCAFVLGTATGMNGQKTSNWFGHPISWVGDVNLGWRLGVWNPTP